MSRPQVSVVLPTRNRSHVLREAIDSVLGQSLADLELIVVDDASTDSTEGLVASYTDPRVRYIALDQPNGASAARNVGVAVATSPVVAFQDSDDVWAPLKLERQLYCLSRRDESCAVVYTGASRSRNGIPIAPIGVDVLEGNMLGELAVGNFITTPTAVVRTEVLRDVGGFDERLPRLQDWDLWLTLARTHQFAHVPAPLVSQRILDDSISMNDGAYFAALEHVLEKHSDIFRAYPAAAARHRWSLAARAVRAHDAAAATRQLWRGFRAAPRAATFAYAHAAVGGLTTRR